MATLARLSHNPSPHPNPLHPKPHPQPSSSSPPPPTTGDRVKWDYRGQRQIIPLGQWVPKIAVDAYVAPNVLLAGRRRCLRLERFRPPWRPQQDHGWVLLQCPGVVRSARRLVVPHRATGRDVNEED